MDEKNLKLMIFVIVALVVGIIAGSGVTALLGQNLAGGSSKFLSMYPPKDSGQSWLVKIDNYVITKKDFDDFYKLYLEQIPASQLQQVSESDLKKNFLDNMIGTYIINLKAIADGTVDKATAEAALRQAIFSIYMNKYSPQDKTIFIPSEDEINQFYNQHRSQIDPRLTADQIQQQLKQYLSEQNYQKWAADFINASRSSYKISSNKETLLVEGITDTPQRSQTQSPLGQGNPMLSLPNR